MSNIQKKISDLPATVGDLTKIAHNIVTTVEEMFRQQDQRNEQKFATKDDLNGFATKDDLNGFATKDDLKKITKEIKKTGKEILDSNLQLVDELKTAREEQLMLAHQNLRNTNTIELHELRISTLERKTHSSQAAI